LSSLGVVLDLARMQQGHGQITSNTSPCVVQVLPSLEDEQIARHTAALCGLKA
jgi:acetate kinase